MSWDSYIDNLIGHSKDATGASHVDKVVIFMKDGGTKCTTDAHANSLKLLPEECTSIAAAFKSNQLKNFQASGVHLEGIKYMFLREAEDGEAVLVKKKDHGSATMQASKTMVVVGHCPEGKQQGNCNKAVLTIVDYLKSINF